MIMTNQTDDQSIISCDPQERAGNGHDLCFDSSAEIQHHQFTSQGVKPESEQVPCLGLPGQRLISLYSSSGVDTVMGSHRICSIVRVVPVSQPVRHVW